MASVQELAAQISSDAVPSLTANLDHPAVELAQRDFFVLSRIDGATNVHSIGQLSGLSDADAASVIVKLVAAEMVSVSGVDVAAAQAAMADGPAPEAAAPPPRPPPVRGSSERVPKGGRSSTFYSGSVPAVGGDASEQPGKGSKAKAKKSTKLGVEIVPDGWPVSFDAFMFDPSDMQSGPALTAEQKQVVLYYHYHLTRVSYYDMFGLSRDASRTEVKLAYFRLSKAFHPDRWFRKETGLFGTRIEEVFKWFNRAYGVLANPKKRRGYDRLLDRGYIGEWQLEKGHGGVERPQTNPKHATVSPSTKAPESKGPRRSDEAAGPEATRRTRQLLGARARRAESEGNFAQAVDLYQRALQAAESADLRIRLAECMLKAQHEPTEIDAQLQAARENGADRKATLLIEAEVARRLADHDRAAACFEAVLAEEPDNPVARLGLERLNSEA